MLKWLYKIFVGDTPTHQHKWKIIKEIQVWDDEDDAYPLYTKYVLQCSECGDLKNFRTK